MSAESEQTYIIVCTKNQRPLKVNINVDTLPPPEEAVGVFCPSELQQHINTAVIAMRLDSNRSGVIFSCDTCSVDCPLGAVRLLPPSDVNMV